MSSLNVQYLFLYFSRNRKALWFPKPSKRFEHVHCRKAILSLYLNVVVECAVFVPVLLQEPEGVVIAKILELNESILPITGYYCLNKQAIKKDKFFK
jgi:hypothetical protein